MLLLKCIACACYWLFFYSINKRRYYEVRKNAKRRRQTSLWDQPGMPKHKETAPKGKEEWHEKHEPEHGHKKHHKEECEKCKEE